MHFLSRLIHDVRNLPEAGLKLGSAIAALLIFIIDLLLPLGVAGGVPYVLVVLFGLWSNERLFSIMQAVICSTLTIAAYYLSPPGGEVWMVVFNRALAIFAIWTTAILVQMWKTKQEELYAIKSRVEKERIYLATLHSSQHIINNLLNELQLVYLEARKHEAFDPETLTLFEKMMRDAANLMQELSDVKEVNEDAIMRSVYPKSSTSS